MEISPCDVPLMPTAPLYDTQGLGDVTSFYGPFCLCPLVSTSKVSILPILLKFTSYFLILLYSDIGLDASFPYYLLLYISSVLLLRSSESELEESCCKVVFDYVGWFFASEDLLSKGYYLGMFFYRGDFDLLESLC